MVLGVQIHRPHYLPKLFLTCYESDVHKAPSTPQRYLIRTDMGFFVMDNS